MIAVLILALTGCNKRPQVFLKVFVSGHTLHGVAPSEYSRLVGVLLTDESIAVRECQNLP